VRSWRRLPVWCLVSSLAYAPTRSPAAGVRSAVRGASPLREELVRPQRTSKSKGKESTIPCQSQHIAHRGPCGKTRVVPQNLRPKPEPADQGFAKYVCPGRHMGLAGRQTAGGTRGAVVGTRRGGAGVRVCAQDCAEQLAEKQWGFS
jgi:hypothetical protein